jgi:hypothetical protein
MQRMAITAGAFVILLTTLSGCTGGTEDDASPVGVGAEAPPFTLAAAEGGTVALADYVGRKPVLLYFSMGPG